MSSLFNPYALTALGKPLQQRQSPELRVETPYINRAQLDMAQHTFVRFLDQARLSKVPNPTEQGRLADGTPYRIVTASGAPIMQVWPVANGAQVGRMVGSGFVFTKNDVDYLVDVVIAEEGDWRFHTGEWVVSRLENRINPHNLMKGTNLHNPAVDAPDGVNYLYEAVLKSYDTGVRLCNSGDVYIALPYSANYYISGGYGPRTPAIIPIKPSSPDSQPTALNFGKKFRDYGAGHGLFTRVLELSKEIKKGRGGEAVQVAEVIAEGDWVNIESHLNMNYPLLYSRSGDKVIVEDYADPTLHMWVNPIPYEVSSDKKTRYHVFKILNNGRMGLGAKNYIHSARLGDGEVEGWYKDTKSDYLVSIDHNGNTTEKTSISQSVTFDPKFIYVTGSITPSKDRKYLNTIEPAANFARYPVNYRIEDHENEWNTSFSGLKIVGGAYNFESGSSVLNVDRTYHMSYKTTAYNEPYRLGFDFSGDVEAATISYGEEYVVDVRLKINGNTSFGKGSGYVPKGSMTKSKLGSKYYNSFRDLAFYNVALTPGSYGNVRTKSSAVNIEVITKETYSRETYLNYSGRRLLTHSSNTISDINTDVRTTHSSGNNVPGDYNKYSQYIHSSQHVKAEHFYRPILHYDQFLDLIIYAEFSLIHEYDLEDGVHDGLGDVISSSLYVDVDDIDFSPYKVVMEHKGKVVFETPPLKINGEDVYVDGYMIPIYAEWLHGAAGSQKKRIMPVQVYTGKEYPSEFAYVNNPGTDYSRVGTKGIITDVKFLKSPATGASKITIGVGRTKDDIQEFRFFVDKRKTHQYEKILSKYELDFEDDTGGSV